MTHTITTHGSREPHPLVHMNEISLNNSQRGAKLLKMVGLVLYACFGLNYYTCIGDERDVTVSVML